MSIEKELMENMFNIEDGKVNLLTLDVEVAESSLENGLISSMNVLHGLCLTKEETGTVQNLIVDINKILSEGLRRRLTIDINELTTPKAATFGFGSDITEVDRQIERENLEKLKKQIDEIKKRKG